MATTHSKERKKVLVENATEADEVSNTFLEHGATNRFSKTHLVAGYLNQMLSAVEIRSIMKVYDTENQNVEVTPKFLNPNNKRSKIKELLDVVDLNMMSISLLDDARSSTGTTRMGGYRTSMSDICKSVDDSFRQGWDADNKPLLLALKYENAADFDKQFISVHLKLTPDILLYEQRSSTVAKDSDEAAVVIEDNKIYDYLTIGKGKVRRISENETQTMNPLYKTLGTNTVRPSSAEKASFVSYYDMFETYEKLKVKMSTIISINSSFYQQMLAEKELSSISKLESFNLATMICCRIMAGNVFENEQRRFRNMPPIEKDNKESLINYTCRPLFNFNLPEMGGDRKAVSCMSFCPDNGDILAVGYGIYSFSTMRVPSNGLVLIWSIKNPVNPERVYFYQSPVVSVEFSPYVPSLIAVGLYNGDIEVRDITNETAPPIALSPRDGYSPKEPITALKWLKIKDSDDRMEYEPLLALCQDGTVQKLRIASPFMSSFKIMKLERVEGMPEGLPVKQEVHPLQAIRNAQGLNIQIHPTQPDIYYVCTDEGCLVKCSTNYVDQHLEVLRTHEGAVQNVDFSPWSPKVFLTCGNDWYIRVWVTGIFTPIISLRNLFAPVHCAYWSRTNSTIILALNRKNIDIWDLRRNLLEPMTSVELDPSYFTTAQIANCGKSVALGNNRGTVLMCALDDFPRPAYFQYEDLEKCLFRALRNDPDLSNELKSIGYFGYPK